MNDSTTLQISFDKSQTRASRRILEFLHEQATNGEIVVSFTEIARALGYSRQTCSHCVTRLEAAGYLTRKRAVGDNGKDLPNTYRLSGNVES
jgi:DNA-binding Lrp family transcriptional regulator